MLTRIIIAAVMIIALNLIQVTGIVQLLLYLATYLIIGYDILKKAGKGIINRQVFDENFLMAVATVGAFALAIYSGSGDYNEAIAVMLFYQIGELFQSYAVGKSRKNISALMDIRPDYANVERNGKLEKVDELGKRKLAYEIAKNKEGYYIVLYFEANPNLIAELERNYRIIDTVIKFMTIKVED